VLRLRFPVVVFPAHGRWRWPGARRNDRSYGAADRAASHPRPRHPAQSVRLGLDCADAAGAREACRLFRTFDIPTMRSGSGEPTSTGGELASRSSIANRRGRAAPEIGCPCVELLRGLAEGLAPLSGYHGVAAGG
jgi:hypothetical protein